MGPDEEEHLLTTLNSEFLLCIWKDSMGCVHETLITLFCDARNALFRSAT